MVAIEIDFVEADDAHLPLNAGGVGVPNSRTEENLSRGAANSRLLWIDYFGGIDLFGQEPDAPIDLTQPPLVVLIVGVLAPITVARRPGHDLRHRRPFPGEQEPQLVSE